VEKGSSLSTLTRRAKMLSTAVPQAKEAGHVPPRRPAPSPTPEAVASLTVVLLGALRAHQERERREALAVSERLQARLDARMAELRGAGHRPRRRGRRRRHGRRDRPGGR
jgi:hypothetical protein